jgi:hypothetical protein
VLHGATAQKTTICLYSHIQIPYHEYILQVALTSGLKLAVWIGRRCGTSKNTSAKGHMEVSWRILTGVNSEYTVASRAIFSYKSQRRDSIRLYACIFWTVCLLKVRHTDSARRIRFSEAARNRNASSRYYTVHNAHGKVRPRSSDKLKASEEAVWTTRLLSPYF